MMILFLSLIAVVTMTACGKGNSAEKDSDSANGTSTHKIRIELEDGGVMEAELYPDIAPITVANFEALIGKEFYDGKTFFRCIPGFVIQGGAPDKGEEEPASIKGEFSANGVENSLKHEEGVLSMARASDPDSASSQFFIMDGKAEHLDGQYAAFGKLTKGIEEVHRIAKLGLDSEYIPQPVKIKSIRMIA